MKKIKMMILCLCSFFLLSGCHFGWAKNGPYHHPMTVQTPNEIVKLDDKVYCLVGSSLYELKNQAFSKITLYVDEAPLNNKKVNYIRQVKANSTHLFVLLQDYDKQSVYIFDKNLKCVDSIKVFATAILAKDDALFYINYDENLCKLDFDTKETTQVLAKSKNQIYSFGEEKIYLNSTGSLYFIDNSQDKTFYCFKNIYYNQYMPSLYTASFLIWIKLERLGLTITI